MLKNKKILLCVTGSIAIYKALELTRLYIKAGAQVKVLMSESAKTFMAPLIFEAISGHEVIHEGTESWKNNNNHIRATENADIVVMAPATANSINKIAYGIADTLLTQTILANPKPLLIAPAANTNMYNHEATQQALAILKKRNCYIVEPISKLLACLIEGKGALAEVETIFYKTCQVLLKEEFWKDKNILITGGGTQEAIDDVRYIGNFSSGKMAESLALAFFLKGATVTLLTSANEHQKNLPIKRVGFQTSNELKNSLDTLIKTHDYLYMAAAVSDYLPKKKADGKLKKDVLGQAWSLELEENIDILANIDKQNIKVVGFKAELDVNNATNNAKKSLQKKDLDAVCLNILGKEVQFGGDKSKITFITKKVTQETSLDTKLVVAFDIVEYSKGL